MSRTLLRCAAIGCATFLLATQAGPASAQRRSSPAERAIEAALASPTIVSAYDEPLGGVLKELAGRHGIPIVLDAKGIDQAGASANTQCTWRLAGISLESALALVLREHDLTFTVENDVLLITSPEAEQSMLGTRVYSVEDLALGTSADRAAVRAWYGEEPEPDFDALIELITSVIAPERWDEVGGPGSIQESETSMSLVVSQTWRIHREIETLLADLRAAQASRTWPSGFGPENLSPPIATPRPLAGATRSRGRSNARWRQLYGIAQPPRADAGGSE